MIKGKNQNQDGFVAIIVAALIMVILALITIGFTRIMQREQRQALDRQLSRQALYAAESGVNDVLTALKNDTTGIYPNEKTNCDVNVGPSVNSGRIDGDNIAYTCVLYDRTPSELVYDASPTESKVIPLETVGGSSFSTIKFDWGNSDTNNNSVSNLPTCGSVRFPASRPNTIPVLKIDLTNAASYDRASLVGGTEYIYVAPCKGGVGASSSHNFDSASRGDVVSVRCNGSGSQPCSITINTLTSSRYISRVKPIYASASVVITATDGGGDAQFKDAQVSIDVTAKANDVVRRLRVSVPFAGVINPPETVFQAFNGVCKLLSVDRNPASYAVEDSCTY